jgi:hypothetical protein
MLAEECVRIWILALNSATNPELLSHNTAGTNKETYWGMCPDMDPDPEKKNAAFANYTACVEAKQLRGAHVQQQEDALSNFGPRTSVEENFFVDVVHGGDGASLDAGADAAMCCMPWHGFEEIMNTTCV